MTIRLTIFLLPHSYFCLFPRSVLHCLFLLFLFSFSLPFVLFHTHHSSFQSSTTFSFFCQFLSFPSFISLFSLPCLYLIQSLFFSSFPPFMAFVPCPFIHSIHSFSPTVHSTPLSLCSQYVRLTVGAFTFTAVYFRSFLKALPTILIRIPTSSNTSKVTGSFLQLQHRGHTYTPTCALFMLSHIHRHNVV